MGKTLHVNLGLDSYDIVITKGILSDIGNCLSGIIKSERIVIITDENVGKEYADTVNSSLVSAGYKVKIITLPAGESTKDMSNLPMLYEHLLDFSMTRSDSVLALGGGVVGDLGGYVAATYQRGVQYIQVPTSLLAQVDSSVGGKVAVNLKQAKNMIGCFYQPKIVIIDPDVLTTLPDKYFADGMAEVVKYGCAFDSKFFMQLAGMKNREDFMSNIQDIIYTSLTHKKNVVEKDVFDTGERMLLNFGHTVGHAIESHYKYKRYSHGEGVAIGMVSITSISERLGITKVGTTDAIRKMLISIGLPTEIDEDDKQAIFERVAYDKKRLNSVLNLILLKDIGQAFIYSGSVDFFR